jgi:hypothetical protein
MELKRIKEGKIVNYTARKYGGRGKIIEVYQRLNGWWLIVHDKVRNKSVTLRPSQVYS